MPLYKLNRKKKAVLTEDVSTHKVGTRFSVTHAGERHGVPVYHCYTERDSYVGLFSGNVLKVAS